MRVLVIEDDECFRSLTLRWLQSYGIEAVEKPFRFEELVAAVRELAETTSGHS